MVMPRVQAKQTCASRRARRAAGPLRGPSGKGIFDSIAALRSRPAAESSRSRRIRDICPSSRFPSAANALMRTMFRLAHISDVHLGPLPALTFLELFSKRITGFVNWHRNRRRHLFANTLDIVLEDIERRDPDHLAITGDLVNLASTLEIAAARQWLNAAGTPENISLVPGNHDAYVRGAYEKATRAWYPYLRGDEAPMEWEEDRHLFPYLRVRGPVALIGCSTAVATPPF